MSKRTTKVVLCRIYTLSATARTFRRVAEQHKKEGKNKAAEIMGTVSATEHYLLSLTQLT